MCLDRFGGAQHAVTVPIDLDEPFEILTPQRYRGASIETSAEAETETERAGSLPVRPVTLDVPRTGRERRRERARAQRSTCRSSCLSRQARHLWIYSGTCHRYCWDQRTGLFVSIDTLASATYNYNYTGRGNGRTNRIAANANHNSLRTAHSLLHSTQRAKLQSAAQRPESRPPGPCAAAHLSWNAASSTPSTKARQVS